MIITVLVLCSCGSDDVADSTVTPSSEAIVGSNTAADGEATTLTGTQICERVAVESVAADLGIKVTLAEPDDSATPQCAYEYINDTGATSNLTIAAMRPEDVGGATGQDAFDYVVRINRGLAGDDADEQTIAAGDNALRLTGSSLHLGVVQLGDHVYTVVVPAADVDTEPVNRLITTITSALR